MPRQLKVYRTSIGFFELAIAAPSMKAAADAWGSDPDIFRRGFAEETQDPKIVKAAMASPGVVLRRPVGTDRAFSEKAALPTPPKESARIEPKRRPEKANDHRKSAAEDKHEAETAAAERAKREGAAAREREEKRLALERQKREAEEARARKRREALVARANAAFDRAKARHGVAVQSLDKRRTELEKEAAREAERWEREQRDYKDAVGEAES